MNILIKDHKDSLESIQRDGQIVYIIGPGVLKSPGHPGGNQQFDRQLKIFRVACKEPYLFKIYNKDLEGHTEYLGEYKVLGYKIKLSFAGFRYYEYKMVRINPFIPSTLD
uniref:Uncharacterized protein n=1 Tax=viral metagenome TaxID=1070528 RepID=A0A6C0ANA6_9ZZZZ